MTNPKQNVREITSHNKALSDTRLLRRRKRFYQVRDKEINKQLSKMREMAKANGEEFNESRVRKNLENQYTLLQEDSDKDKDQKRKRINSLIRLPEKVLRKHSCVRMFVESTEYGFNLAGVLNPIVPLRMSREWAGQQESVDDAESKN